MTNENSKHSKKEQPQKSDEDFLWKGSTEEYLDSLIVFRKKVYNVFNTDAAGFKTETQGRQRGL